MTRVDQFESVFRHADKPVYHHEPLRLRKGLVITDLDHIAAVEFGDEVRRFLSVLGGQPELDWRFVEGMEFQSVGALLSLVEEHAPDLVCTYRHLHNDSWKWPHSLGAYVDVLTQATAYPVVVLPHPQAGLAHEHAVKHTSAVMAITDHLAGDDRLVHFATGFVNRDGTLYLTHIEDEREFERTIEVISKIPSIDTETAREEILKVRLGEPHDFIHSCREALERAGMRLKVEAIVAMGNRLSDYRRLINEHRVDLLVFNTKDADQLAMHGMAYPLAVELREIPLLML